MQQRGDVVRMIYSSNADSGESSSSSAAAAATAAATELPPSTITTEKILDPAMARQHVTLPIVLEMLPTGLKREKSFFQSLNVRRSGKQQTTTTTTTTTSTSLAAPRLTDLEQAILERANDVLRDINASDGFAFDALHDVRDAGRMIFSSGPRLGKMSARSLLKQLHPDGLSFHGTTQQKKALMSSVLRKVERMIVSLQGSDKFAELVKRDANGTDTMKAGTFWDTWVAPLLELNRTAFNALACIMTCESMERQVPTTAALLASNGGRGSALVKQLRSLAPRLLHAPKMLLFSAELLCTATAAGIGSEIPPPISISIDRLSAADGVVDSDLAAPRSKADIFSQLEKGLRDTDVCRLRIVVGTNPFNISLVGESGVDQGGVYRDILSAVVDELKNGKAGMTDAQGKSRRCNNADDIHERLFILCANGRDSSASHRECLVPAGRTGRLFSRGELAAFYRMVGKLMGVAIRSDTPMSLCFAPIVYKGILGMPLCWEDVCEIDSFVSMFVRQLETRRDDGWEDLFEDSIPVWSVLDGAGRNVKIGLRLHGDTSSHALVAEDIPKYIAAVKSFRIHEYTDAIDAIRQGLGEVVPLSTLTLFSWKDLSHCVEGRDISIVALKKKTVVISEKFEVIEWLWEILESYSQSLREKFLRFVWGRSRLPTTEQGWGEAKMTVTTGCGRTDGLPLSHTCNFQLDLPHFSSKSKLRERLTFAILSCGSIDSV
jgi:hypothetical protein